jgi:hypothetical protein
VSLGGLVAAIAWARHRERHASGATGRALAGAAALSLVPALAMVGVFYLKFDAPVPDMMANEQIGHTAGWKTILETNGGHTAGLIFTPTELMAYFRPDTLIGHKEWPWIRFRFPERKRIAWIAPLPPDGVYVERTASATATMPLAWILNVMAMAWVVLSAWPIWTGRRRDPSRADWLLFGGSLACAATMTLAPLTTVGITNRYLGDFYTISVVGFAVSHRLLLPSLSGHRFDRIVASAIAILLAAWGVLATISLTHILVFP